MKRLFILFIAITLPLGFIKSYSADTECLGASAGESAM